MKLSEKIYTCRKRSGKSQEELAALLNVSRQAVSKWETGEAEPEIRKLQQLAGVFGVTTDWLLSEEALPQDATQASALPHWIDSLPGFLGKFLRRYGYLAGIYVTLSGLPFLALGIIEQFMLSAMVGSYQEVFETSGIWSAPPMFDSAPRVNTLTTPLSVILICIMVTGGLLVIAGIILTLVLRRYRDK